MNDQAILEGLSITLHFETGSTARGTAGPYNYRLDYEAIGGRLMTRGIGTDRVGGELPQEQERQASQYTSIVIGLTNFDLSQDSLELLTSRGDTLVFRSYLKY
jgi:hypothetical protein